MKKELLVKKLHPDAILPTKPYSDDAAWDLYSVVDAEILSNCFGEIDIGISIAIPQGYFGQILARSSFRKKNIFIAPGCYDSGYRGRLTVWITNFHSDNLVIKKGDRIAQLVILPVPEIEIKEVQELPISERGEKGHGSSGK